VTVRIDPIPVRWDRALCEDFSADGPLESFYEINAEGVVIRQIDLEGHDRTPITASRLAEWWEAQGWVQQAGTPELAAYRRRYGGIAELTVHDWDPGYPGEPITPERFEEELQRARSALEEGPPHAS
jgi:hypothetical protein